MRAAVPLRAVPVGRFWVDGCKRPSHGWPVWVDQNKNAERWGDRNTDAGSWNGARHRVGPNKTEGDQNAARWGEVRWNAGN